MISLRRLLELLLLLQATVVVAAAHGRQQTETPCLNGAGVDVFVHGMRAANTNVTYPCIRIPSVVSAGEGGAVVAFMECRFSCADECWPKALEGTCWKGGVEGESPATAGGAPRRGGLGGAGSPFGGDVCMKRSTDGGANWGELLVAGPGGRSPSGLWDPLSRTITLAYTKYYSLNMYLRQSTDGGAHWTAPRSIDDAAGIANHSAFQPGTGITLVGGPHAGRKLWAMWGQVVGGKELVGATVPLRVLRSDDELRSFSSAAVPGFGGPAGFVGGAVSKTVVGGIGVPCSPGTS
eukprot:SAG11_NODE_5104_length_1664_cov_1.167412_1_plen_292_part_10